MVLPLSGKKVLNTREAGQAKKLTELVHKHGGEVVEVPLLTIACRSTTSNLQLLKEIHRFEWIFFTSRNGVHCFFELLKTNHVKLPRLNMAVVGNKTEDALHRFGYDAELVPAIFDGENLVNEFLTRFSGTGDILLVQGNRSRDVIAKGLSKAGIPFESIVVYDTVYNQEARKDLRKQLEFINFDYVTFTSPSSVEAFVKFKGSSDSSTPLYVCIGKTTEERAKKLGLTNTISPEKYTIEGMVEEMCRYNNRGGFETNGI